MALGVTILAMVLVTIIEKRSTHRGYHDVRDHPNVQSPVARILDMGPQCAQAVGVYKAHKDRENLQRKSISENSS
ncbi:MAG: hypothetical protein ACFFEE_00830 [Candidatus Thorarchaeota archaeon]